jgi:predicted dehydrogenase
VAKGRERGGQSLDEFEVYGTEGTLIYHLHRPHEIIVGRPNEALETLLVPDDFLTYPGSPRDPHVGNPTVTFRYDQDFAFTCAIVKGRVKSDNSSDGDDLPTFYDGMRCQAVIDAVLQSARERRWVEVADPPSLFTA